MSLKLFAILLATPFLVAPAAAGEPTAPVSEKESAEDSSKKVCKRIKTMGSNRKERVCMTKAEWDAYRDPSAR